MKIRTDFVTNSSSSSFTVLISVEDKKGNVYSCEMNNGDYEGGGDCRFNGNLEELLINRAICRINEKSGSKFKLEKVNEAGRPERIENVKPGDIVELVKIPGETKVAWNKKVNFAIDVRSDEGSLGLLPEKAVKLVYKCLYRDDHSFLHVTIASVTPLSKRKDKSKGAEISVLINADEVKGLANPDLAALANYLIDSTDGGSWGQYVSFDDASSLDEAEEYEDLYDEDYDLWEEKMYELAEQKNSEASKEKDNFIETVSGLAGADSISKIVVRRDYEGWGEGSDRIPQYDEECYDLAKQVLEHMSGPEKDEVLRKFYDYLKTSKGEERHGEIFGYGFDDVRYVWDESKNDLLRIAERIAGDRIWDITTGREFRILDLENDTYEEYAEFDLDDKY